jgi:hypothetical protein
MKACLLKALGTAILCLGCVSLAGASQIIVNFDHVQPTFGGGVPFASNSNMINSWMTFGMMRITGGIVMADAHATSAPNVYASIPLSPSANIRPFGFVEMAFTSPVSDVSFDVINMGGAAGFTAYALNSKGTPIGLDAVNLSCWDCSSAVSHVSFDMSGISEVIVGGGPGGIPATFAVDTVGFAPAIPEPGGLVLLGSGIVALCSQRRRFFNL